MVELGRLKFYWVLPGSAPLSHGSHHPRNSHGTRWNPKHGDCKMLIPFQNGAMMVFTSAPYQTNLALQDKGHTSIK